MRKVSSWQNLSATQMADLGTLKDLKGLLDDGVITQAEFEAQKKATLAGPIAPAAPVAQPVVAQPVIAQPMAQHVMHPGVHPGVHPGTIMMMTQAPQTLTTPELKAMAKDLKCCSIALLVFSILSLTDLFVLIPGCVTASQFVCEDVALMSIATLKDKASCAKCGATTTIVLSAISLAGCMAWGLVWFVWGGWILVAHGLGFVLPALICACLICCKAGRVVAAADRAVGA